MHDTALKVIALAVGATLLIMLFNVYKPQVTTMTTDVMHKPPISNIGMGWPDKPKSLHDGYAINNDGQYQSATWNWKDKGTIHIGNHTNKDGVWELVTSGVTYNPNQAPKNLPEASIQENGQTIVGDLATKDGQKTSQQQQGLLGDSAQNTPSNNRGTIQ